MINQRKSYLDIALLTHEHNDHVIGLDDMRPLIFKSGKNMPLYSVARGSEMKLKIVFLMLLLMKDKPGAPAFDLHTIDNKPFEVLDIEITPIEVIHYKITVFGYKFKNLAYITDAGFISETEKQKLKNLDVLILNCIRKFEPHPAHFILEDVINLFEELKPKNYF